MYLVKKKTLRKITEQRIAFKCVADGKFSNQTINRYVKEVEIILKDIEKCDVSVF